MAHDDQAAVSRHPACWYFGGASCLAAVLAFATAFPLMLIGVCGGWAFALLGTCFAIVGVQRTVARGDGGQGTPVRVRPWLPRVVLLVLLLGQTFVSLEALRAVKEASKANVSAAALRSIGSAIAEYARQHGACPSEWNDLAGPTPLISPWQFLCGFDPDADRHHGEDAVSYSSYVYKPIPRKGLGDTGIVLAWEREPWSRPDDRLWSKYKRWALFADGEVRPLDNPAFAEAIVKDNARRKELGWPMDVVYTPSTRSTSQQTATQPALPGEGGMR